MSKRPEIDWSSLTAETAEPMPEATQRSARITPDATPATKRGKSKPTPIPAPEADEEDVQINFKVPKHIKHRFARTALDAGMKHNKFLPVLLDLWDARKVEK